VDPVVSNVESGDTVKKAIKSYLNETIECNILNVHKLCNDVYMVEYRTHDEFSREIYDNIEFAKVYSEFYSCI